MKNYHQFLCSSLSLLAGAMVFLPLPALAQRLSRAQWKSKSGNLVFTVVDKWGRSCAAGTAQATYQVKDGSRGLVYPDDCEDNSGLSRFEDTGGVERCVGSMQFDIVRLNDVVAADTTWVIKDAVPGFPCSTKGQTFEVRLFLVQ